MPSGSHEKMGKRPEQRSDATSSAQNQSSVERYGFEWTDLSTKRRLQGRGVQGSSSETITQDKHKKAEVKRKEEEGNKIKKLDASVNRRMGKMTKLYNEIKGLLNRYQEEYPGQYDQWLGVKEKGARDILDAYDKAEGFKAKNKVYKSFRDLTTSMENWIEELKKV